MLENPDSNAKDVVIAGLRKVYKQGSVCGDGKNVAVRDLCRCTTRS